MQQNKQFATQNQGAKVRVVATDMFANENFNHRGASNEPDPHLRVQRPCSALDPGSSAKMNKRNDELGETTQVNNNINNTEQDLLLDEQLGMQTLTSQKLSQGKSHISISQRIAMRQQQQ